MREFVFVPEYVAVFVVVLPCVFPEFCVSRISVQVYVYNILCVLVCICVCVHVTTVYVCTCVFTSLVPRYSSSSSWVNVTRSTFVTSQEFSLVFPFIPLTYGFT